MGKSLMALAVGWPMVVAGRWLDRFGKGLRSAPRDALIVDLVNQTMLKVLSASRLAPNLAHGSQWIG
ncbi:MAG: hypothetical protein KF752_03090 [Pirellulaceae bacterium]|nr:hypothetical protein [Pirellulaceae bacterium]